MGAPHDAPSAGPPRLADENFPGPSVRALRSAGHDVLWIAERSPGLPDPAVVALARAESRVALTFDRDLAERIVRFRDPPPPGLVLLRFLPRHPMHAADVVLALLRRDDLAVAGRLTVVTADHVRQRPILDVG